MANTTNLNLVKPAGTDKALVSVLNSNSDKIDAWAGTTNQALSTYVDNGHCKIIASSTDINTITTPGHYYMPSSSPNAPFEGYMDVYSYNSEFVKQIAYTARRLDPQIVFRTKQGGVWDSNWLDVALKGDAIVTAYSGTTIVESSVKRIGDLVSGTVVFKMDASATTWKNAFQVSPAPKSSETYAPCILTNNGQYLGMCKFYNNTAVQIYPLNAITASSQTVSVTFSYAVN